jgi:hypothetical protein
MTLLLDAPAPRRRRPLPRPVTQPPEPEGPQPSARHRWARLLLLATCLLFCHPCHGDEDDEPGIHLPARREPRQQQQTVSPHRPPGALTASP